MCVRERGVIHDAPPARLPPATSSSCCRLLYASSSAEPPVSDAEKEEDAAAAARQDWKAWYKDFPVVRRMVCTMLCRALVRGCDDAATLLAPAATVAVRRMADQRWLWATLGELLQKSADAAAAEGGERGGADKGGGGSVGKKNGKEKGAAPRVLKPEVGRLPMLST